jgi:hypothetical protein
MKVEPRDWVETSFHPHRVVAVGLVDTSFLSTDPERGSFVVRKIEERSASAGVHSQPVE